MYVPRFNALGDEVQVRRLVASVGAGELITGGPDGYPLATRLPLVWDGPRVLLHMAWANPHWRSLEPETPALLVVTGPEAYISPTYYATKSEHGRVVPTWNYSAVHLTGRLSVHTDPAWLRAQVGLLTDTMEAGRAERWSVDDAPAPYVDQQLKAIVGLELVVERVEGKAKLSQNRSDEDRTGAIRGLRATGRPRDGQVAEVMEQVMATRPEPEG
jgi:transcriptional regulator